MSLYMLAAAKYTEVADHSDIGVVVVTGLVLVFAVLILLYLLIALEGVVFSNLDKKKQQKAQGGADAAALPAESGSPRTGACRAGGSGHSRRGGGRHCRGRCLHGGRALQPAQRGPSAQGAQRLGRRRRGRVHPAVLIL